MKHLKSYNLFESKLQTTYEIQEFLWKYYQDSPVIQFLSGLLEDDKATDTLNFLQVKENDWVYFSPDSKYSDTDWTKFDWEKQRLEAQSTKIGRIVKQLLPKNTDITDKDIEKFVNIWKSYFIGEESTFEEIKGEEIKFWYSEKNYNLLAYKNTLGKSCMSTVNSSWFNIYTENPKVVSMLIQKDGLNKLLARAIVWQTNIGPVLDRVYYTHDWNNQRMTDFFKKQYPNGKTFREVTNCYVKLNKWKFVKTGYPFLDNFSFLDWETGKLWSRDQPSDKMISLKSTSGSFQIDSFRSIVFSSKLEDFIQRDKAYWDSSKDSWMPLGKLQIIRRKIKDWIDF